MKQLDHVFVMMLVLPLLIIGGCQKEQRVEKCEDEDMIRSGEYVLVNGYYFGHPSYAQCIFDDPRENTFGWIWEEIPEYPGGDTSAYVFYGTPGRRSSPRLWDVAPTTTALPISINDIASITVDYDVLVETTSRYCFEVYTENLYCTVGVMAPR